VKLHRLFPVVALFFFMAGSALAQEGSFWPRDILHNNYTITIFQPQVESFEGTQLLARAAISIQIPGEDGPVFGAVWMDTTVLTDRDTRMVYVQDLKVTRVHIPETSDEQQAKLAAVLEENMPKWDLSMSLDDLLTGLEITEEQKRQAEGFNNEPPVIYVRNKPAVLVLLDGEAQIRPVDEENTQLERVVNTAFVLLRDGKDFYLYAGIGWMTTRDLEGAWTLATRVPDEIADIGRQMDEAQKKEDAEKRQQLVDAGVEVDDPAAEDDWTGAPPEIIVSTVPAELIVFDGEPALVPVEGDGLLYVDNTSNDVLLEIENQMYYVLLSGRWFKSASLDGPWDHVPPDQLPRGFAEVSPDSDIGDIRPFVAGTQEAEEAVLDSFIPQTATIKRDAPPPDVQYDGDPKFEPVEGTSMTYAVNTGNQIIFADRRYWLCYEGAWYVSQDNAGPWAVATEVAPEIYSIPASNPNYNCTFVKVYNSTPEVVYVGYYPGYTNSYVYGGTVVYGTGWYYPGWYGYRYWYPRPVTFGFGVGWNPWTGWHFGFGWAWGPFRFGIGLGGWGYRGGWWGVAGWRGGYRRGYRRGYARGYASGRRHASNRNVNINNVNIGNNIYNKDRNRDRVASTRTRETVSRDRAASGARDRAGQPSQRANNVFSDSSGNVYRRNENGSWDKRDGGSWKSAGDLNTAQSFDRSGSRDRSSGSIDMGSFDRGQTDRSSARTASGQQQRSSASRSTATRGNANSSLNRQHQSRQRSSQRTQSYNRSRGGGRSGGGRGRR